MEIEIEEEIPTIKSRGRTNTKILIFANTNIREIKKNYIREYEYS